jgi:gluconolactonase
MKASVFDERINKLGEGPTATGEKNNLVTWVDIHGMLVRSRDLASGAITEFSTNEHVGFQIPTKNGSHLLGTVSGPVLRTSDGSIKQLVSRSVADGFTASRSIRWNDGKVSPQGDLFLGTMAYDFATNAAAFYQMNSDGTHMRRLFGDVTISNGLDWSPDARLMYYIDSPLRRVDVFDVEERDIKNRRTIVKFDEDMGSPDGMCIDSEGNLWVAFFEGGAIRCFDSQTGKQLEEIECAAHFMTSCAFAGENLDQLIMTSFGETADREKYPEAGMTLIAQPGVRGRKTNLFGGN